MSNETLNVKKFGGTVMVPQAMLDDGVDVRSLLADAFEGSRRDRIGERIQGPRRWWRWESLAPDYLYDLNPNELLAEAKRLHALAQAFADIGDHFEPDDDDDVDTLRNLYAPMWEAK